MPDNNCCYRCTRMFHEIRVHALNNIICNIRQYGGLMSTLEKLVIQCCIILC